MSDWSFARVWDAIAEVAPEREAVVCGPTRLTYGDLADRAARLATHLAGLGVGPGDKVAIDLINRPEYLEAFWAALNLGAVPLNVNYRYGAVEIQYLLDDADAKVVVTEPAFVDEVTTAAKRLGRQRGKRFKPAIIEIGADYEALLAGSPPNGPWRDRAPSGDDLIFLYTGGTTGMPKGVMWRNDDLYAALWGMGRPGSEPPDPVAAVEAGKRAGTALPACPLMHGTGLFITLSTLSGGGTVVLIDRTGLDAELLWDEVERNSVQVLTIVGDAFARPLLAALDAAPARWDLTQLRAITSSGVTWSPETKRGLLDHIPSLTLLDSLGASEGLMTRSSTTARDKDIAPARFAVSDARQGARRSGQRGPSRHRGRRHGGRDRADPTRLLQGSQEDRRDVPRGERRPVLDPGRLRDRRCRRHDSAAGPRVRDGEHRWREGLHGRNRARAAQERRGVRLRGDRDSRRPIR